MGYGSCYKCGTPWNRCKKHSTKYTEISGCFPLCEDCWSGLVPETRLPYYKQLWHSWQSFGYPDKNGVLWETVWEQIEAAVMAGG